MTKQNDCYAYFSVKSEDLVAAEVTSCLGINPTLSWSKGDLTSSGRERMFGVWALHSRRPRSDDLEDHVQDVLDQMDDNPEAFLQVSRTYGGVMQLVGEFHQIGLGLHFTKQVIAKLSEYGLCVDFDAYYLYSDSRESTMA